MPALLAIETETSSVSATFWVWGGITILLATALGFFVGMLYANRHADRNLRKALTKLSSLYALVVDALDKAQRLTLLLEKFPGMELKPEDIENLERRRNSLAEAVGRLIDDQRDSMRKQLEVNANAKSRLPWQRAPADPETNLPVRSVFDQNLRLMLEADQSSRRSSGLLLVKIDRMDQLKSRFGIQGEAVVAKEMASVIAKSLREQDLACRLGPDFFGALIPGVDSESTRKLATAIRNSVRLHTFRVQENGPEVMVTASFGCTLCAFEDNPESAVARAGEALVESSRRGRNQLHISEGKTLVHCAAG